MTQEQANILISYVDKNYEKDTGQLVLSQIDTSMIEQIHKLVPRSDWQVFCGHICTWLGEGSFRFSITDAYAIRLTKIFELSDVSIKSESAIALIHLAYNHHRFFVMRRVFALLGSSLDKNVAQRLRIEFTVNLEDYLILWEVFFDALTRSPQDLHPLIQPIFDNK